MPEKIKEFYNTDDIRKFWLHIVITAFAIWAVTGITDILLKPDGAIHAVNEVVGGVMPCIVMAGAVFSIAERKLQRTGVSRKQKLGEAGIIIIFLLIVIFAELIAFAAGTVSYGVPLTLSAIAIWLCFVIAGPKFAAKERMTMKQILMIIFLGGCASVVIAKFCARASELLSVLD